MKIKFIANWCKQWQKDYNIPEGHILLKVNKDSLPSLYKHFKTLQKKQDERQVLIDLDTELDIKYKKRTNDQNALMWSLYTIEANEHNAGQSGHKDQIVTPEELYQADLEQYAPRYKFAVVNEKIDMAKLIISSGKGRIISEKPCEGGKIIEVLVSSSFFNTKEMGEWVDRIFNRLAYNGLDLSNSQSIKSYWQQWRDYLNTSKLDPYERFSSVIEYKANVKMCEACGKYIGDDGGSIAHIKARGMGGNSEDSKEHSGNWLHLCDPCHAMFDNGNGRDVFIKKYPHLRYKIEKALSKELPGKIEDLRG